MTQIVTPYLLYEDAVAAIAFISEAFGFHEVNRATGAAGGLHAELEMPPSGTIYVGQPPNGFENPSKSAVTSQVYVLVEDVDAHHDHAVRVGAQVIERLNDLPFGHRRYGCADPQGHQWYFAQVIG
jgi:uncharacterized glyoxalase superfamily protein PhnB